MTSNYKLKMVLVGAGAVGKTSLVHRFVNNKFDAGYALTVGVDFLTKNVEYEPDQLATLSIWDVGGQQRFESIRTTFYRGAKGCLLVFDLTREPTFRAIQKWLSEIRQFSGNPTLPFILIGNKLDLLEDVGEVIDRDEARAFAENEGSIYIETSAKTGSNVETSFTQLTQRIISAQSQ